MSKISEIIRSERLKRHLSIRNVASKIDIAPSTLSRIEKGQSVPDELTIYKLAQFFHVTESYLSGKEKTHDPNKPNIHSNSPLKDTNEYQSLLKVLDMLNRDELIMLKGMVLAVLGTKVDENKKKVI